MDLLKPLKGARDEFRRVCKENTEINAMPAITQEEQTAKHRAVIAARERRLGKDDGTLFNKIVFGSETYAVTVYDRRIKFTSTNQYLGSWAKCIRYVHRLIESQYPDTGMDGIIIQGKESPAGHVSYNHPDGGAGNRMWIKVIPIAVNW